MASSPAEPWIVCLARSVSVSISAFAWLTFAPAALRAASSAVSRSAFRCFGPLLPHLENLGTRVAQLVGVLCSFGFRLRDRLMRILDRAFSPRAALCQRSIQRSLHQNLVSRTSTTKSRIVGIRAEQKRTDLLKTIIVPGDVCVSV